MISGFSNERVSYRTRYLQFPSQLTENVPSISKPTVHVIKIRFNNIIKNEKLLFALISISLSVLSLFIGYGMFSMYRGVSAEDMIEPAPNSVAMEELNAISAEDAGITVMNKAGMPAGASGTNQGSNYFAYNGGGGYDSNSMLMANANTKDNSKADLTSKKAVIDVDDQIQVNPFLPVSNAPKKVAKKVKPNSSFVLPPTTVGTDPNANILMNTMVSGIMYDTYSPSAILQINKVDYLVRSGDVISNIKVVRINPKTVDIKIGNDTLNAPVGRILATLSSNNNTSMNNLNTRFGGSQNKNRR